MFELYEHSWPIYRAAIGPLDFDVPYYQNFCQGHHSLELFAGFGRLTNPLANAGIDLTAVEIRQDMAQFIELPREKVIVGDVLDLKFTTFQFERIFAGYNSFCLLTENNQVTRFFNMLARALKPGGKVSLSYYHQDFWSQAIPYDFEFEANTITYLPKYDLSRRQQGQGIWIDAYSHNGNIVEYEYPVKLFESDKEVMAFAKPAGFELEKVIVDYGIDDFWDPGWLEYVLIKC